MIVTTFLWTSVLSATFVRTAVVSSTFVHMDAVFAPLLQTKVVSAPFVETPPEWLHKGSTGVASPRVSPDVLPAIFVQSTALLATLVRKKVLPDTLM